MVVDAEDGPLSNILVDGTWITAPCSKQTSLGEPCLGDSFMHDANHGKGQKYVTFSKIAVAYPSRYKLYLMYSASPSRASNVPVTIGHDNGISRVHVNQRISVAGTSHGAEYLGAFDLSPGQGWVKVSNSGTSGKVIVDALIVRCAYGDVSPPTGSPTPAPTGSPTSSPTENTSPTSAPTANVSPTTSPTLTPTASPTETCVDVVMDAEDHHDVAVVGRWVERECDLQSPGYCQNKFFLHDGNAHKGSKYVRFGTSSLHTRARYLVRMAYSVSRSRADFVPVTIATATGDVTVLVNQRSHIPESDGYVPLGIFELVPTASSVTIGTAGTEGKVIVDAIKFVCADRAPAAPTSQPTATPTAAPTALVCEDLLVDPSSQDSAQAVFAGVWVERVCDQHAPNPEDCSGTTFYHDSNTRKGESSVTVQTHGLKGTTMYEIFQAHSSSASRASNVPVTINHAGGSTVVIVNQRMRPNLNGFVSLGKFVLVPGVSTVVVENTGTDGKVIFDAIGFRCAAE